jgi:hypothetical protein
MVIQELAHRYVCCVNSGKKEEAGAEQGAEAVSLSVTMVSVFPDHKRYVDVNCWRRSYKLVLLDNTVENRGQRERNAEWLHCYFGYLVWHVVIADSFLSLMRGCEFPLVL